MNKDTFRPDGFLNGLYNFVYRSPYQNISGREQTLEACKRVRESVARVLALDKIPNKTDRLSPAVLWESKRRGYTLQKLSVEICSGWNMLAYMLSPDSPNGQAVVAACGHGYGVRQILRLSKDGRYRAVNFLDNYQKNFALELAARNNTVIAFEPVGFGEAKLLKDAKKPFYISSCSQISSHTLLYGLSTASLRVYQALRSADLLSDSGFRNIGIMGISGGGLIALYSACLDSRFQKIVLSGYVNTFKDSVLSRWHCPDNYVPRLLECGEMYDFAAALAPRKLLIEAGTKDKLFPICGAQTAIDKIKNVYHEADASESFEYDIFNGKHSVSGAKSFDFFNK